MRIDILDPVYIRLDREAQRLLKPYLSVTQVWYQEGQYRRIPREYLKPFFDRSGLSYRGFLPFIKQKLQELGVSAVIEGESEKLNIPFSPSSSLLMAFKAKDITLRDYQMDIPRKALLENQGLIICPTGSGKTVIASLLIDAIREYKTLFMCHTLTLINQTLSDFKSYGFRDIRVIAEGEKDLSNLPNLVIASRQSMGRLKPQQYTDLFDMVIVDEAHHCSKIDNQYAKILRCLDSPLRFGLTATIPQTEAKRELVLSTKALFGEVVGEFTLEEGIAQGILAKPYLTLIRLPLNRVVKELRTYNDVYDQGVIYNTERNKIICSVTVDRISKDKSVLILVRKLEHGELLLKNLKASGVKSIFVKGATDTAFRERLRKALHTKQIKCIVANVVWREGVNVPSLGVIMNASGGKDEIETLQSFGRGFRTTEDKDSIEFIDFFDPSHRFLIEHFGERLCLYFERGWIGGELK